MSTVNQQGILRSLLTQFGSADRVIAAFPGTKGAAEEGAGTFFAFTADHDGNVRFIGVDPPSPAQSALAEYVHDNPELEPRQMVFEALGTAFVWIPASPSIDIGTASARYLAYQREDNIWTTRFKLYLVPSAIAAIVVIWISVWSGLIAKRAIMAHEKQQDLEMQVIRQEEASRVKSAFLANMNHELRTPLNAIIGFSQMMQLQILGPIGHDKYNEYVENIIFASSHLRKLIGNILDISKIEAGEETLEEDRVCFKDVVTECVSMTQKEFEKKDHKLILDQADDQCCILGDRLKIRQILLNLLTNANKFTPQGGTVTVSVGAAPSGGLAVTVTDTGKGIAPDELDMVLQPFKRSQDRADRAKDGFGLGLPLSFALAELHGASFDMQSELGVGTTVKLVFPETRIIDHPAAPLEENAA